MNTRSFPLRRTRNSTSFLAMGQRLKIFAYHKRAMRIFAEENSDPNCGRGVDALAEAPVGGKSRRNVTDVLAYWCVSTNVRLQ